MQEGRSSRTAAYVALLRALGDRGITSAKGFHDAPARRLLPSGWARMLSWFEPALAALPARLRGRLVAHVDLIVSRALAIDAELAAALAAGCRQVVILGAGFDGRAHRLTALRAVRVFEVDHPATQSEKRLRAAGLPRTCDALTYVGCDFERDSLADRLHAAGHRVQEPTVWIWEGVTLYLGAAALGATLATVVARSAACSRLVVEYHDAEAAKADTLYAFVRKIVLALWAEPQIGARSQRAFRADLERAGFELAKEFGVSEWGAAFAGATSRPRTHSARIAVATV